MRVSAAVKHARFSMPAEWSRHLRTLMAWPTRASVLTDEDLAASRDEVATIANTISKFEPVTLFARPEDVDEVKKRAVSNVSVTPMLLDNLWIRDTGPTFVKADDGTAAGLDFNFHQWGHKLPETSDHRLASRILSELQIPAIEASITAEGGGIEVDGEGTMLATESCLINPNRNPGRSRQDLEQFFRDNLGIEKVIWLEGVRGLDITDCHVDALARFVKPAEVCLSRPAPSANEALKRVYDQARSILTSARDAKGRMLKVREVEEAAVELRGCQPGDGPCLSYVNFLLVNGGVLIPKFGDSRADEQAARTTGELFPDRKVAPVRLEMLPKTGGGIHCATQQQPV